MTAGTLALCVECFAAGAAVAMATMVTLLVVWFRKTDGSDQPPEGLI